MDPELDHVTGLRTVHHSSPKLLKWLDDKGYLGIVLIDLSPFSRIERDYGVSSYNDFLKRMTKSVQSMAGKVIRHEDAVLINAPFGEQIIIVLSQKRRGQQLLQEDMELVGDRVFSFLLAPVIALSRRYFAQPLQPDVGYSFLVRNPVLDERRVLLRLFNEARDVAKSQRYRFAIKNRERLKELIVSQNIETVFQPIVNVHTNELVGYEALSRGPAGSVWQDPNVMFSLALETDLPFELDRLCRRLALKRARRLPKHVRVFINTLPVTLNDPEFRGKYLQEFLETVRLAPTDIVFEVTETMAIEEYDALRKALKYYRGMGFAVAIDDAGTGYANLEMIMQLCPEFIKVDLSLIRNIGHSILKRELVKALQSIGQGMGARLIAEGVEKVSELRALRKLGIDYAQGFLFARPGKPFPKPTRH